MKLIKGEMKMANTIEWLVSKVRELLKAQKDNDGGSGGTTGDYIPLTGTEENKPVTGYIEIKDDFGKLSSFGADSILFLNDILQESTSFESAGFKYFGNNQHTTFINFENPTQSNQQFFQNKDGIIALLSDVYDSNSYLTDETKTGGTWIDGKPIYTITKLTADPVPSDIETQFPNIIVGSYTVYKYTKTTD